MALIITPKPQLPPASCFPLKIKQCFLTCRWRERGQVGINPSRRVGHLTAVAPGQSQRDTLSVLDHCWKCFYFFGGDTLSWFFLSSGICWTFFHRAKNVVKTCSVWRSVTDVVLASSQWRCTKAKCPSEWEEPSPTNWTFSLVGTLIRIGNKIFLTMEDSPLTTLFNQEV